MSTAAVPDESSTLIGVVCAVHVGEPSPTRRNRGFVVVADVPNCFLCGVRVGYYFLLCYRRRVGR